MDGERKDLLTPDKTILDSASGNIGVAYAMIGAVKGYKVKLIVPAEVSEERKRILAAYGAEVVFSDPLKGSDGAIELAHRIYEENPTLISCPTNTTTLQTPKPTTKPQALKFGSRLRGELRTSLRVLEPVGL